MEDYLETHFEVVSYITSVMTNIHPTTNWNKTPICLRFEEQGTGGLYLLAKEWSDEFSDIHKDTLWGEDLDWNDALNEFFTLKDKL
jgi:hypothetical protein